jgi:ribosomal protein L4
MLSNILLINDKGHKAKERAEVAGVHVRLKQKGTGTARAGSGILV